jgi:NAD-reducing hydrogenase small subunit
VIVAKPKIASVWLEACAGCHMSFLDIDERIVGLLDRVELTATPITDIKVFPEVEVGVIEGALGNEEELHLAKELRERCKILIAWGDCAVFGGINCMRNFMPAEKVLEEGYVNTASTVNPGRVIPRRDLPPLLPQAIPVDRAVKVDVYVPGCPPDADTIMYVFSEILEGRIPSVPTDIMRYD